MRISQVKREALQEIYPVNVARTGNVKRHWQVWHYLIPAFITFWIIFGIVLVTSGLLFLAVSALAVIALFSILIIALAWAFQNDR